MFDRREEDSRRLRLRHPDTDRQTEQVTSAQTDSVAKPTAKEVQNNKMQEMINLVHSKTNCWGGSYPLRCKFKWINANLVQTQIRFGLNVMPQQVLNEGDDFLYLSRTDPQVWGHFWHM